MYNEVVLPSMLISIITVTWNSEAHILRCFTALSKQTLQDFEVVLVDNGSVDNTIDELRPDSYKFPIIIKKLHKNMGFAVANNIGARLAHGKWLRMPFSNQIGWSIWLKQRMFTSCIFSSRQI